MGQLACLAVAGREPTVTVSSRRAANGYEVNTEDDGAHVCCGEKLLPGATALWGLELRLRGFFLVERVREATSDEVVT